MEDDILEFMHERIADNLWLRRGEIEDDDQSRIDRDWYDARRLLGYELMDGIIKECKKNRKSDLKNCELLPARYYPYLSAISTEEFKRIKAYYIWKEKYKKAPLSKQKNDEIYYMACRELEECKNNCLKFKESALPSDIVAFIQKSNKDFYDSIVMRKVHWLNLNEGKYSDYFVNRQKSEDYVNAIYNNPVLLKTEITEEDKEEILGIIEKINKGRSLTNLFEYCLKCHLLRILESFQSNLKQAA